jgi:hypothetical protein
MSKGNKTNTFEVGNKTRSFNASAISKLSQILPNLNHYNEFKLNIQWGMHHQMSC